MDLALKTFRSKKSISIDDKNYRIVEGECVDVVRVHIRCDKLYVVMKNLADNEVEMLYDNFCVLFQNGDDCLK